MKEKARTRERARARERTTRGSTYDYRSDSDPFPLGAMTDFKYFRS